MIELNSIKNCNVDEFDEIYLIVRSIDILVRSENPILDKSIQLEDLSPSKDLFFKYRKWYKEGIWDVKTFKEFYKPQFIKELKHNNNALELLAALKDKDEQGLKIALLCFCDDKDMCHRKIIYKVLKIAGCNVVLK